jgi:hypothetical protein
VGRYYCGLKKGTLLSTARVENDIIHKTIAIEGSYLGEGSDAASGRPAEPRHKDRTVAESKSCFTKIVPV